MKNILFLKPHLEERVWGSDKLKQFHFNLNSKKIGEAWAISGFKNKSSLINNGPHKGKTLRELYETNNALFGGPSFREYPLLVKILDCNDDLSIQVHPNDSMAQKKYNSFGKNECWYILNCEENSEIIFGHGAKTKKEFVDMVNNNEWEKLLQSKSVKKGDFINVPAGTIHAIKKGIVLYELQQSSDITFRLYDYNRQKLNPERTLHIEESIEAAIIPHKDEMQSFPKGTLINNDFFNLEKMNVRCFANYRNESAYWLQATVVSGFGLLNGIKPVRKGTSFIVTSPNKFWIKGWATILISYIKK